MRKKKVIGILAAVLLLVSVLCVFLLFDSTESGTEGGIALDAAAEPWEVPPEADTDENGIRIPGYGEISFPEGERDVQLTLYNPEKNDCLFAFSLYLDDETDPIYTSDYVKPGMAVRQLELDRALDAGEYTLYIKIAAVDEQSGTARNGASVKTRLLVS